MIPLQSITYFRVGLHPIADNGLSSHAQDMNATSVFQSASQKVAIAQESVARADLNHRKTASAPSPEAVARLAYTIYENQGSQPGHEVKHWLEAEARLIGGVERETQMRSGSSLFTTEH